MPFIQADPFAEDHLHLFGSRIGSLDGMTEKEQEVWFFSFGHVLFWVHPLNGRAGGRRTKKLRNRPSACRRSLHEPGNISIRNSVAGRRVRRFGNYPEGRHTMCRPMNYRLLTLFALTAAGPAGSCRGRPHPRHDEGARSGCLHPLF